MKRIPKVVAAAATASVVAIGVAAPAQAADRTVRLTTPSGAVHAVLTWDDSVDTLCLTLRSTAAGATALADMRLTSGAYPQSLQVSRSNPRQCTGNLSIPEDRLAEMRVYGGTNTFWNTSGWQQFHT